MIGGGCTFLKLARKVDEVKATLDNDEQKVCTAPSSQQMLIAGAQGPSLLHWGSTQGQGMLKGEGRDRHTVIRAK